MKSLTSWDASAGEKCECWMSEPEEERVAPEHGGVGVYCVALEVPGGGGSLADTPPPLSRDEVPFFCGNPRVEVSCA